MEEDPTSSWCSFIPHDFLSAMASDETVGSELRAGITATMDQGDNLLKWVAESEPSTTFDYSVVHQLPDENNSRIIFYDVFGGVELPGAATGLATGNMFAHKQAVNIRKHITAISNFFFYSFGHTLFENQNCTIAVTVNYGDGHMNAHWTGKRVVVGSGNPAMLYAFDGAGDVLAHELTHGIIARTSCLENRGEAGALNEHLADVFGLLYKHYQLDRAQRSPTPSADWEAEDESEDYEDEYPADDLDTGMDGHESNPESRHDDTDEPYPWVIGDSLWGEPGGFFAQFDAPAAQTLWTSAGGTIASDDSHHPYDPQAALDRSSQRARIFASFPRYLRSFSNPRSTKPPQPVHYDDLGEAHRVHRNSGIANYAFYLAAAAAGGSALDGGVGQVWFRVMTERNLGTGCGFARFAAFTLAYAERGYPALVEAIQRAWVAVGVEHDNVEDVMSDLSN